MVRLKTRYLLFEILYPKALDQATIDSDQKYELSLNPPSINLDARNLNRLIKDSIDLNFGEYGLGSVASSLAVKYFSQATSTGIVRVSRMHFRMVWAALSYITDIKGQPVIIKVTRVSGTIKKCEQAIIKHNKKRISSLTSTSGALSAFVDQPEQVMEDIISDLDEDE